MSPNQDPVATALARRLQTYAERHPASRAQHEAARAVLPGGNTRSVLHADPFPITLAGGRGARLHDLDGHEYLDFLGEFTAGLYGHSHPVIRAAIDAALDGGWNLGGHNRLEARLAELVCRRFPSIERVRFTNSGTEANLMALAAATAFTGRRRIVVFSGGYHGGVLGFGGGGNPVNVPHDFVVLPYDDAEAFARGFAPVAAEVAAVLVEPMQGAGGCIAASPAFLQSLREACSAAGALLVFDEVMSSRLGPSGLQGRLGIRPDLTTLGKYIGGGMSFGAFGGRAEVMDLFDPGRPGALPHAGTFNNNVLTMAAGIAGLGELYTPEVAVALNARGDALRERLGAIACRRGAPLAWRGIGSLMNLVLLPGADARLQALYWLGMLERGFWVARRGFVVLSLPLADADLDAFATAFDEVAAELAALHG